MALEQSELSPRELAVRFTDEKRAWYRERRRQTLVSATDLPKWWKAVAAEPEYSATSC